MPIVRAQVVLPYASGLPRDVITNTFHFRVPTGVSLVAAAPILRGWLATFYDAVHAPTNQANYMNPAAQHVNFYDLSEPTPRIPETLPLNASDTDLVPHTVPAEVAIVLSFQAAPVAGVAPQSRRGRIYLGGLGNVLATPSGVSTPEIHPTIQDAIVNAASGLRATSQMVGFAGIPTGRAPWCIWSPTLGQAFDVVSGWVEDEPDTQRRRGTEPGSRMTFSA